MKCIPLIARVEEVAPVSLPAVALLVECADTARGRPIARAATRRVPTAAIQGSRRFIRLSQPSMSALAFAWILLLSRGSRQFPS
jgi:hypothetical protein